MLGFLVCSVSGVQLRSRNSDRVGAIEFPGRRARAAEEVTSLGPRAPAADVAAARLGAGNVSLGRNWHRCRRQE